MPKHFNLEKAKSGNPIKTMCGFPARIVATDIEGCFPLAVAVKVGRSEHVFQYDERGHTLTAYNFTDLMSDNNWSKMTLVMA